MRQEVSHRSSPNVGITYFPCKFHSLSCLEERFSETRTGIEDLCSRTLSVVGNVNMSTKRLYSLLGVPVHVGKGDKGPAPSLALSVSVEQLANPVCRFP